ncbi:hypothetical protein ABL78_6766 [Leptomonas seymouri]|uniref:C-type lectin domain-containing protein n=1 Tax=Leptomonas seymouri TaxID=5684 RepID=A0A0N0P3Y0_LEPSE|nr:hypothetical protein ABL78_6766 [Leptomonas seymouri]|eukprot:KPI84177.1 hypothetical protein ABL78_6766 [Leptomonas seymouri]
MSLRGSSNLGGRASTASGPRASFGSSAPSLFSPTTTRSVTWMRRGFLLVAAALIVCIAAVPEVLHITLAHAATSVITCPYGWSLYEAPSNSGNSSGASPSSVTRQCVRVFATASVPSSAAKSACESILIGNSDAASRPLDVDGVTPWPFAHHVSPHGAVIRSADENTFLQHLFLQMAGNGLSEDTVLILGGVAGYGSVAWYADRTTTAPANSYTNFAKDVNWQLHAGTIVMRPSGVWDLLPANSATATIAHPFACAFDASAAVITPDSSSSHGSSIIGPGPSSSSLARSSSSGAVHPGRNRAHRPAVPQPAPACLDGWTPLPSSVDTSEGADNTVCYLLVANASEVGGRLGKAFAAAREHCAAAHPKATLASVMSRSENEWIVSSLLSQFPVRSDCNCESQTNTSFSSSSTSSSSISARTVFLGGSYMRDGTGAGLIGNWYADQHLFQASDYAAASPSSPSWPTVSNDYFSNWRKSEPLLSYGVVGITPPAPSCQCNGTVTSSALTASAASAGTWVGVDPRSTQPFLCSYLNDGSTFPAPPPPTTPDPGASSTIIPGPSDYCLTGWSYLALTNSCYRVYPITSTSLAATPAVTAATMEEECRQVLSGHVVPVKVSRVRAVSILSITESHYVGALLQNYIADPINNVQTNGSATPVSLAGISFIDSGEGGFYISGVRELDTQLALSLWADSEPSSVKGCIAVDVNGLWYYIPCSTYTSSSTPDNTAVQVEAFTCQYNAKDIDPHKDGIHTTTTTTPEPTSDPGWSSESSSGSGKWLPLGERVAALSGATHVVVAAGSTGIYTLQGPNATIPAAASVHRLHLYFAPLSAFYSYPAPASTVDGTAIGSIFAASQRPPASMSDLLVLSPNASVSRPFAPCEGYKDQSRISRVHRGTVTVHHANTSEVGYVCVSQDGKHYLPTAITYEVAEVTVHGFISAPVRTREPNDTEARPTWLPPLFCRSTSDPVCAAQQTLAVEERGTGTVQLALRYSSVSGDDAVVTAQSPTADTMVSHVRFSATPDCMGAGVPFYLMATDIALQHVASARYTRRTAAHDDHASEARSGAQYSVFSYQSAAIRAARFSALKPLYNSSDTLLQLETLQPPVEYYVCVAMRKTSTTNSSGGSADLAQAGAASRRLLSMWNVSSSGRSSNSSMTTPWRAYSSASSSASSSGAAFDNDAFLLSIADRLAARTSLSPTGAAVRTYTAVPGLKVHIVPRPVSIKGMWALPPRRLAQRDLSSAENSDNGNGSSTSAFVSSAGLATLVPTPATFNRSAHYRLRPTYAYTYGTPAQPHELGDELHPIASASHLHISQYSSPILLLDGHHVEPGMLALLSQDPNSCNRLQPVPRDDPTPAAATWPQYLDTMVPLSTVSMRVEPEDGRNRSRVATMAYMQLNLNHTGLWGHHPTRTDDVSAMEQTWYVCLAYGPLSPFMPLREPALKITVHRLHVERFAIDTHATFTSSDAVAAAEATDSSTTHLNLNTGFAGMLWMQGLDVRLWATATVHSSQVVFSVVLPGSGTSDETAAQCAHSNLFYAQHGIGLLTQDRRHRRRTRGGATHGSADVESTYTGVGIVAPLGFFARQSTQRMQVCLSVPLPFSVAASSTSAAGRAVPQQRFFAPVVSTTLDVRPIQLLYMGRFSAIPSSSAATTTVSGTVIRLAEGMRDVVMPLTGYGIRPDMTMFLSSQACHGVQTTSADATGIVMSQSLLNMTIVSLYDLPSSYWNTSAASREADDEMDDSGRAHRPRSFVVLRHGNLLRKAAAQRLFRLNTTIDPVTGMVTTMRMPLHVCLYAPGTATLVFPTDFQLVVDPPRLTSIRNLPSDAALITRAAASMSVEELSSVTPNDAMVVYASSMDLVVEGFGLDDTNTWLIPALDCNNASSFLWRAPVTLSALPSSHTTSVRIEMDSDKAKRPLYADSSRYVDPQTSSSSWFATLQPQETVRFGSDTSVRSGQVIRRFQWCVRIVEADETTVTAAAATVSGYVSTHLPYQLMIPTVQGFANEHLHRGAPPPTALTLPTQHPTKGRWFSMQLVGPLVDVVHAIGSPLYMFLAPEDNTCHEVKNSYLNEGLHIFGNASFTAVNGSAVLLPRWLATAGNYRLCASAVYPTLASADEGIEAALQFLRLGGLRVQLIQAVYGVFALNHTTTVTVHQGQEWTLPISGSMLTNRSTVRFKASADQCADPMVATRKAGGGILPDIPIQNTFTGFSLFGQDDASSELDDDTSVTVNRHYIVLSQSLIRALDAPASYVLCLQPQHSLTWRAAPSITLTVLEHVRRPTHYNYFPADGSEDVVALTALAPTKVALEWNTGEENTVNIVGAAGQQASLALWCRPAPNTSTSSHHSAIDDNGIVAAEGLVPCGDHRRLKFVKPLDSDEDPCFVDAEAVSDDILRGPYVLDFGVLTLPHSLSMLDGGGGGDGSSSSSINGEGYAPPITPNMTQPWIMCLETGPERWREPAHPMLQLQYTRAIPTGFRLSADDASNTTAPFPAHRPDVEAMTTAEVDSVTGMPIGGNTTLLLHAQDSSQVVYLNGYGIERGHKLRFGSFCEEEMLPPHTIASSGSSTTASAGSSSSSSTAHGNGTATSQIDDYLAQVSERQELANPRLYTEPLRIEDGNGVFLLPSTHILESEDARSGRGDIPMCISTDDGHTYRRTSLTLRVLPSRLQTDTETQYRNLLERILANTLLVPQLSRGSVDLSELVRLTKGTPVTASDWNVSAPSSDGRDEDRSTVPAPSPAVYVRVGTQVLLSASCSVNTHGLPLLTVNVPNVITLTKQHTAVATSERLRMCFRGADAAASAADGQPSYANSTENEMGAVTPAFLWDGLYYRVLGVRVEQVSLHAWAPTDAMKSDNINHVVLRRGAEEGLLLPVLMEPTSAFSSSSPSANLSPEDELLQLIQQSPSIMSVLSLTRLYVGRPCFRSASEPTPATAVSPYVTSYAGMQLNFSADAVAVSSLLTEQLDSHAATAATAASLNKTLVAALPSGDGLQVPQFPLEARGSVCLSVDGGRHYLAVGIAQFTEDWAPTLRVTLDTEDDENNEDVKEVDDTENGDVSRTPTHGTTTAMRVYAQSSTTRRLMDTRFADPRLLTNESGSILQVLADLSQLTTTMLWSGFIGEDGFAMDGLLYLPATPKTAQEGTQQPQPLRFSLDNRLQNMPTNLSMTVVPWSLTCYASSSQQDVFVRQQDIGLHASTAAGVCSAGMRDGARVRVVPLSAAACDDPAAVDASYVMDLLTVQPGSWGADTTLPSGSALSASPFRAMQLPMSLGYVPEGAYALCLRQDLPFVSTWQPTDEAANDTASVNRALYTAVYAPTPLRLHVSHSWTILSISGATISEGAHTSATAASSVVALAQSSNAVLTVTGTAIDVRGVPLLLALAPNSAQQVLRRRSSSTNRNSSDSASMTWTWSNGCSGVPESWDPVTGASQLLHDYATSTGKLLSAPWYNAQSGLWKVDAAYLQEVEWQSRSSNSSSVGALVSYTVCYSIDGGLSFHPAGLSSEAAVASSDHHHHHVGTASSPASFKAIVMPPTITSLSASRAVAPGVDTTPDQLRWTASAATATSVRVQMLSTSSAADTQLAAAIPRVTPFSRVDGANASAYATRPHRYDYAWTGAFVGNGMGTASGRALPTSASPSTSDIPTVAAAVALVRTSLHGARCDGIDAMPEPFAVFNASNAKSVGNWSSATRASPLAAPIFVVNLQHGGVWSSADTAAVETWRSAPPSSARLAAFDEMNAVLAHGDWVRNTAEMWAQSEVGVPPINGALLMGRAATEAIAAARSNGESILVCLSTDGTHFYSADVARAAFAGGDEPQQSVAVSAAAASSTAAVGLSPWPLYLRASPPESMVTANATATTTPALLWMREMAMVMELLARPVNANSTPSAVSPSFTTGAASLTRFQVALAAQLGVDASVIVVQLARSGVVTLPLSMTSSTTALRDTPSSSPVSDSSSPAVDEELRFAIQSVQARQHARVHAAEEGAATTAAAADAPQSSPQLPTYALVVSIIADAIAYDAPSNTSTLTPSPDLLYRTVELLCSNATGPALLATLVPSAERPAIALSSLTINFTLSNGVDLHTAAAVMPAALPTSPAQEVAWRHRFMSIPYTTVLPEPVPDADDNDTTAKVSWWVIPILLILPAGMIYGTYHVYRKYLKKPPDAAAQVTVEDAS